MENPKEAAKKFIRALRRQYDSVASQPIQCAQCKIKPGVNFCGGECKDANVRYCSQVCANLHWSDHMCLIAGKRDREKYDLPSDEEEQKKRNMVSHGEMLYTGVLPQNEAFYQALIDGLTIEQITQYSLVSKDFGNQIVHNPLFWFLFLKKHVPFRLLILHATAAQSNDVTIDRMRSDVDYERYGRKVMQPFTDPLGVHYMRIPDLLFNMSIYIYDSSVYPTNITYKSILKAYEKTVHNNDYFKEMRNYEEITDYFSVKWEIFFGPELTDWNEKYDGLDFGDLWLASIPWDSYGLKAQLRFFEPTDNEEDNEENNGNYPLW